jgi:hypothetical protein
MTPFEQAQADVKSGKAKAPIVNMGGKTIDYFAYQLRTHKFNLSLMAKGMKFRGITFTQIKKYYGLNGRGAKDCLPELEVLIAEYQA